MRMVSGGDGLLLYSKLTGCDRVVAKDLRRVVILSVWQV